MIKFFAGVVVGIYLATAGVSGLISLADKGVETVKTMSNEVAK